MSRGSGSAAGEKKIRGSIRLVVRSEPRPCHETAEEAPEKMICSTADSLRARARAFAFAFDGARVTIASAPVLRVPFSKGNKQTAVGERGLPFDVMQRTYSGPNWAGEGRRGNRGDAAMERTGTMK